MTDVRYFLNPDDPGSSDDDHDDDDDYDDDDDDDDYDDDDDDDDGTPPLATVIIRTYVPFGRCVRNHAEHLGEHVTDGCVEFYPLADEGDAAFLCAVCGCQRTFHPPVVRTDIVSFPFPPPPPPPPPPQGA